MVSPSLSLRERLIVAGLLRPQRLENSNRDGVMFRKDIAQAQQIARLLRFRLIANHRSQRRDRPGVIPAAVLHQTNVQPDARHFGLQPLGFLQQCEGLAPILAAHGDYTQVGVRRSGEGIELKYLAEIALRFFDTALGEGVLPALKKLRRIGGFCLDRRISDSPVALLIHSNNFSHSPTRF